VGIVKEGYRYNFYWNRIHRCSCYLFLRAVYGQLSLIQLSLFVLVW